MHIVLNATAKFTRLQRLVFLSVSYILGIGFVSLVGKAMGADFLDRTATKTTWKPPTGSEESNRMY